MNGAVGAPRGGSPQWTHRGIFPAGSEFDVVRTLAASHSVTPSTCSGNGNEFGGTTCGIFGSSVSEGAALFCWGSNACGQVGPSSGSVVRTPERSTFPILGRDWILDVGGGTVCAASRAASDDPRALYCWGDGSFEKLLGTARVDNATSAVSPMDDVIDVSVGTRQVCAVGIDRRVYCWGGNTRPGDGIVSGQAQPDNDLATIGTPTCVPIF